MNDHVTYSLKYDNPNSESYYLKVRSFTDEVIAFASHTLAPITKEYVDYLKTFNLEEIRKDEEYILELLSFGILWRTYANTALAVKHAPFVTMSRMGEWRKKHQHWKPLIDFTRGIFITLFLLPENPRSLSEQETTIEKIDHVCKWFEATGEFREEALRFIRWRAYWESKSKYELAQMFSTIREFTNWFEKQANESLGIYTQNVNSFLMNQHGKYKWREDRISCMRTRLEYHLNMVGAELLNRAFREDYQKTKTKSVLVPGCMRRLSANECKAVRVKVGLVCNSCLPGCNVNKLQEMGKKNNFDVFIIPHASDLSLWSPKAGMESHGVIASACVTTLVEGGWELKRYDVPAQCVLLDYCGCKKHWHCLGLPTEFNIRELRRILN